MQHTHCPLCGAELEVRDVAPCAERGGQPQELDHFGDGRHTYAEMRIFGNLSLVLCDFCQVDFGSFDPQFFGLPRGTRIGFGKMEFVRRVENLGLGKDKWCPQCGYRLAFLRFVAESRQLHSRGTAA